MYKQRVCVMCKEPGKNKLEITKKSSAGIDVMGLLYCCNKCQDKLSSGTVTADITIKEIDGRSSIQKLVSFANSETFKKGGST